MHRRRRRRLASCQVCSCELLDEACLSSSHLRQPTVLMVDAAWLYSCTGTPIWCGYDVASLYGLHRYSSETQFRLSPVLLKNHKRTVGEPAAKGLGGMLRRIAASTRSPSLPDRIACPRNMHPEARGMRCSRNQTALGADIPASATCVAVWRLLATSIGDSSTFICFVLHWLENRPRRRGSS